ncbi:CLK4 isoform 3 [Pongo abelii]|nr:CLK4 isoform 3 [Pongo abelii]
MRHSKRTHCPDWDSRESWGHESYRGSHKRKRRSHSSTQENRHCKPHHQFKESDWTCVDIKTNALTLIRLGYLKGYSEIFTGHSVDI